MTEREDLDEMEEAVSLFYTIYPQFAGYHGKVLNLCRELREARERIYDLTACLSCDLGLEDETCTCTEEKKNCIGRLKEELREAQEELLSNAKRILILTLELRDARARIEELEKERKETTQTKKDLENRDGYLCS